MKFGDQEIAIILDYEQEDPTPLWRKEKKEEYKDCKFKTIQDLERWIQDNKEKLPDLHYTDLPVYVEYDVTSIDMMRAEAFQLVESKAIVTTIKAMEKIGSGMNMLWYFITSIAGMGAVVLMFLYFADQGVFL